jgi:YidC/Oxa1 family membrane protein insertase
MLCVLILMVWTITHPPKEKTTTTTDITEVIDAVVSSKESVESAAPLVSEDKERILELEFGTPGRRGSYMATFTNRGGRLLSLRLGDAYDREGLTVEEQADPTHWVELLSPVAVSSGELASFSVTAGPPARDVFPEPLDQALWKMDELKDEFGETVGVRFSYGSSRGVVFTKELRPRRGERIFDLRLGLENVSATVGSGARQFSLTPAVGVKRGGPSRFYSEPKVLGAWVDEDGELRVESEEWVAKVSPDDLAGSFNSTGQLSFAGAHNKFFACLMQATPDAQSTLVGGVGWRRAQMVEGAVTAEERSEDPYPFLVADVDVALYLGEVGEQRSWDYVIYAGPKAREDLLAASPDYEALTLEDIGWFTGVGKIILAILGFYQGLVGSWGLAIILMTLTVRLMLFPINRRSQTAMARFQTKMKRVQPKVDALKEKYANNPQKQREEQGKLMQEEGAFPPLGGCLPMFLQFPVFIGLFGVLKVEYHLRQEPFLWIRDLSLPDHLMRIDLSLPIIGTIEWLNILPFVMVAMMVLQQSAMPTPTDPQQARMQKMMRWFLVIMGVMLYSYPAGLALYMITSSSLGLFEIMVIKKLWPIDDTEQPTKKGWMMRMAEKQAEQQESMRRLQQQQRMSKQKAQKNRKKRKR